MIALLFVLLFAQPFAEAPTTVFTQHCYGVAGDAITFHFGYTSNLERHFVGDGFDFVTDVGVFPDAFTIAAGYLPAPDLTAVAFTELVDTSIDGLGEQITLVIDWSTLPECGEVLENPYPTPTACDLRAIDGATGEPYCYTPTESGVIPLPPAYH